VTWRVQPEEDLGASLRRVALEEIAKVRADLRSPETDRAAAIHSARRSFKKLRALTRLGRLSLGAAFAGENRRWRDAGRALSETRDADVLAQSFDAMAASCGQDLPEEGVTAIRESIVGQPNGGSPVVPARQVEEALSSLDRAERRIDRLNWPKDANELFGGLRDSQRRLRRSWSAARKNPDSETLHDWRKRVKDFSAQLSLFRTMLPDDLKARRRDARRLAEMLGEEHDLCILSDKLKSAAVAGRSRPSRDLLLKRVDGRREALRRDAFAMGETLSSLRPKRFAAEITETWRNASPGSADEADRRPGVRHRNADTEAGRG